MTLIRKTAWNLEPGDVLFSDAAGTERIGKVAWAVCVEGTKGNRWHIQFEAGDLGVDDSLVTHWDHAFTVHEWRSSQAV